MNAPILLIVFNRPDHTRRTLKALMAQCPDELYVYQDGAREGNEKDEKKCEEVREVIKEVLNNTSAKIHMHCSNKNMGCRDHVINAITEVLKKHEEVIVVEDDIVTSSAFLTYMSSALDFYKERKGVWSISGWSPSPSKFEVRKDYHYDVYCSPRQFSWGWGTWRDRWEQVDWSMAYYEDLMQNDAEKEAWSRGGDDLLPMLKDEKEGKSSAWDIQFSYAHFKNNGVSIVPCISYTKNIGLDGSGTHCVKSEMENDTVRLNENSTPRLLDVLYYDKEIINGLYSAYCHKKRPFWKRVVNTLARLFGRSIPYKSKGKVYV